MRFQALTERYFLAIFDGGKQCDFRYLGLLFPVFTPQTACSTASAALEQEGVCVPEELVVGQVVAIELALLEHSRAILRVPLPLFEVVFEGFGFEAVEAGHSRPLLLGDERAAVLHELGFALSHEGDQLELTGGQSSLVFAVGFLDARWERDNRDDLVAWELVAVRKSGHEKGRDIELAPGALPAARGAQSLHPQAPDSGPVGPLDSEASTRFQDVLELVLNPPRARVGLVDHLRQPLDASSPAQLSGFAKAISVSIARRALLGDPANQAMGGHVSKQLEALLHSLLEASQDHRVDLALGLFGAEHFGVAVGDDVAG